MCIIIIIIILGGRKKGEIENKLHYCIPVCLPHPPIYHTHLSATPTYLPHPPICHTHLSTTPTYLPSDGVIVTLDQLHRGALATPSGPHYSHRLPSFHTDVQSTKNLHPMGTPPLMLVLPRATCVNPTCTPGLAGYSNTTSLNSIFPVRVSGRSPCSEAGSMADTCFTKTSFFDHGNGGMTPSNSPCL